MKILVVDDEHSVRKTLKKILTDDGYDVHCVKDGGGAIESVKTGDFKLVLLDLKINGMDGIAILNEIRKTNSNIPVILISGYLTMEDIEKACRHGIFSYIRKPFKLEDLRHKINRAFVGQDKK
ncbi:MAG: response regulator [Planctomycetota bacterium]|jgi:DNA-binding NtrC family response regulator